MHFLNFVILLDIAPPKIGGIGTVGAVAFGLILTAIALAVFLLLRKKLSTTIRLILSIFLIVIAFFGSIAIVAGTSIYDWKTNEEYQDSKRRQNNDRLDRLRKELGNNNTNTTSNTNTNINIDRNSK